MSARLFKAGQEVRAVPLASLIAAHAGPEADAGGAARTDHAGGAPHDAPPYQHQPPPAAGHAAAAQAPARAALKPAYELGEAVTEAERILEEARAGAAQIEEEARQRAAAVEREARERGLREARDHFDEAVADALAPWRGQLAESLADLATLRQRMAARVEQDLVRLALEIARKVVHREVHLDHEIALTLARVALSRAGSRALARVRLNPSDFSFVESRLAQLGAMGTVELIEDHTVGRGGCVVETDTGDVDARIEQQFADIERGLMTA
jgi:flagellar assembly protein FliH